MRTVFAKTSLTNTQKEVHSGKKDLVLILALFVSVAFVQPSAAEKDKEGTDSATTM